jgi:phytoene/squalene synthetase
MNGFRNALRLLTLPCTRASRLISESLDRRLTRAERFGLGMHKLLCRFCKRYEQHVRALRAALEQLGQEPDRAGASLPSISPEALERIRRRLRDELGQHL